MESLAGRQHEDPQPYLLSLSQVSKTFPGVRALDNVDLNLSTGEVLGLIGENGAGKSTLIKILGGIYPLDTGQIRIDGKHVSIPNVRSAMHCGISIIHQELNLCDNLNIAENIFLGRQPEVIKGLSITDKRTLHKQASELLKQVGLEVSTKALLAHLSIAQKQMVEIAKSLSLNARIIVFDEPTSSLSSTESEKLFELIMNLRNKGVGVIYISHRLAEVKQIADRVVVLRDGKRVGALDKDQIEYDRMVTMMVGRDIQQYYHVEQHEISQDDALRVEKLSFSGSTEPVSFNIKKGEIVGFFGLVGAGRTELACSLFGINPSQSGKITIDGKQTVVRNPRRAIEAGILMVPEDRKTQGLILEMTIPVNISLACLGNLGRFGLLNRKSERELAEKQIKQMSVRNAGLGQRVLNLSGGNQQKIVLAKWLSIEPKVLILDEPTRGIDVGAKSEIYALISRIASQGVGVMLISSEMEEVISVSNRIIVMNDGRIKGNIVGDAVTEENIMSLSLEGSHV